MKRHWRLKTTFWLDMMLLLSVCMLETVRFTGLVVHEWLGLAIVAIVLAHLLFSWSWIATQSRRLFTKQTARERINYAINFAFFFAVTAAIFSGILMSQKAIPALTGTKALSGRHGLALGRASRKFRAHDAHFGGVSPGD